MASATEVARVFEDDFTRCQLAKPENLKGLGVQKNPVFQTPSGCIGASVGLTGPQSDSRPSSDWRCPRNCLSRRVWGSSSRQICCEMCPANIESQSNRHRSETAPFRG